MKLPRQDWAQAGKALFLCSGLACIALAYSQPHQSSAISMLIRFWVGGFGFLVALFSLRK